MARVSFRSRIGRERERERDIISLYLSLSICIYIYIYIHTYRHTYIHTYSPQAPRRSSGASWRPSRAATSALRFPNRTNRSAALFANTLILGGLRALAAGSRGFMRINKIRPSIEIKTNNKCAPVPCGQLPSPSPAGRPSCGYPSF